jgi:hypothetical protein
MRALRPSIGARVIKEPSKERREALALLEELALLVAVPDAPLPVAELLPEPEGEVPEAEEGEVPDGLA